MSRYISSKNSTELSNEEYILPNLTGDPGQVLKWPTDGSVLEWGQAGGSDGVIGPAESIINNAATYSNATGDLIGDSGVSISTLSNSQLIGCSTSADGLAANNFVKNLIINNSPNSSNVSTSSRCRGNTFLGYSACSGNTLGIDSVCVGKNAAMNSTESNYLSVVGSRALENLIDGDLCCALGYASGFIMTNGNNCTYLGATSNTSDAISSYRCAIGAGSISNTDNQTMIGSAAITQVVCDAAANCDLGTPVNSWASLALKPTLTGALPDPSTQLGVFRYDDTLNKPIYSNGIQWSTMDVSGSGTGNVVGPSSSIANNVVTFNNSTGDLIQDSGVSIYSNTATNQFIGAVPLSITSAVQNVSVGASALLSVTSGNSNTALGSTALQNCTTGFSNSCTGSVSGYDIDSGSYNSCYGNLAGSKITSGSHNTLLGYGSGLFGASDYLTTGFHNVYIGRYAHGDSISALNRIAIGSNSSCLLNNSVQLGDSAVDLMSVGSSPVFKRLGVSTQLFGCDGTHTGIDSLIMNDSTNTGSGNSTCVYGVYSGIGLTTGAFNSLYSAYSGTNLTTGSANLMLGYAAGSSAISNLECTLIGYNANVSSDGVDNEIVIGANSVGSGANTCTIGNASCISLLSNGTSCELGDTTKPFNGLTLKPISGAALPDPITNKGSIKYDNTKDKPVYSDGTAWNTIGHVKVPNMSASVNEIEIKNYINEIKNTDAERYIVPYVHASTSTANGYMGGVCTPSDRLYLIPHGKSGVAFWQYIDSNGKVVSYEHANLDVVGYAYSGGCLSPSAGGRIFFAYSGQASNPKWQYISSDGSVVSWEHGVTSATINSVCYSPENNGRVFLNCDASSTAQTSWHYIDSSTTPPIVVPYVHGQTFVASAYSGCVYCPQFGGRIYLIPNAQYNQANYHYIDVSTAIPTLVSYPRVVAVTGTYWGGAYSATQQRVYMAPYGAGSSVNWAYLDVSNEVPTVVSYTHSPVTIGVSNPFIGCCFSPCDNKIYFSPYGVSASDWVYVDCEDGSVNYLEHTGTTIGGVAYRGMSYHPTLNRVYAIPSFNSTSWHYIKPLTKNNASPSLMMGGVYNN